MNSWCYWMCSYVKYVQIILCSKTSTEDVTKNALKIC